MCPASTAAVRSVAPSPAACYALAGQPSRRPTSSRAMSLAANCSLGSDGLGDSSAQDHMHMLTIVTGPMKSGKSSRLIQLADELVSDGYKLVVVTPACDTRTDHCIASRDGSTLPAIEIISGRDIRRALDGIDENTALVIDEGQFIVRLYSMISRARLQFPRMPIIIAGLRNDSKGHLFGDINALANISSRIIRMRAECAQCGAPAAHTQRLVDSDQQILVGDDIYEPRCADCWRPR